MKAQTKALLASIVVIALALTAVSGVTYSWFSDTEKAEIGVSTATVDYDIVITGKVATGSGTVSSSGNTINISDLAANQSYTINVVMQNNSTIATIYRISVACDTIPTEYDCNNIMINGKSLSSTTDHKISLNWTPVEKPTTKGETVFDFFTISTTKGYGSESVPADWNRPDSFSLTVTLEVYQGDIDIPVSEEQQNSINSSITNGTKDKNIDISVPERTTITLDTGIAHENNKSRTVTFKGDGTQTVDVVTNAGGAEGGRLNYQRGSTFTFNNLTIQAGEGDFDGIVCDKLIFKDCVIKGKLTLYGEAKFENCTFENTMANQYSIWTWGGTDVTFENCTFNTNGKAILLYGGANDPGKHKTNLVVNNCTFNDRTDGAAGKAAIEIGNDYNATYALTIDNTAVNGFADGKNTGFKLWANKNSMDAVHLTVTIDGVKIQ